jgi:hypothetical protein
MSLRPMSTCKVELLNPLYVSNKTHNLSTDLRLNHSKEANHERCRLEQSRSN